MIGRMSRLNETFGNFFGSAARAKRQGAKKAMKRQIRSSDGM
jgi:hypothetical protein